MCSTATGCTECQSGFYLDEGQCKSCNSALPGCKQCLNADVCTMCASEFLTIDAGRCICRDGVPNQIQNMNTGACECRDGYYMTATGCLTCEYMIPYCEQCSISSQRTGLELYGEATFLDSKMYLTCDECGFGRFLQPMSGDVPIKCQSCQLKYSGCESCSADGQTCNKCMQTHLLEGGRDEPCIPCNRYMAGCIKCTNKSTCTQRAPVL